MTVFLFLCVLALTVVAALLFFRLRQQARLLEDARERIAALGQPLDESLEEPYLVLTVRVLDPLGVARRESRSARIMADHMPNMISRRVYQEVMREVGAELTSRGIEAEMNVEYR
ncbi:hypothetical protein [Marinobacter bohaiensis]|uniref:hypothetical protein n=1 Tax=Marinobacter bohaiensis TaxID=2201898 RepID=UPI0013A70822|nr:hypothetical protein [Marinobacter bohaiensis]